MPDDMLPEVSGPYHRSVLTGEMLSYIAPSLEDGASSPIRGEKIEEAEREAPYLFVDATFGGGGHTRALLEHFPAAQVVAIDIDRHALDENGPSLVEAFPGRLKVQWGNFVHLAPVLKKVGVTSVDGILADFGTSQHQIMHHPGFSFWRDEPLDMRMSQAHATLRASDIVAKAGVDELAYIFYTYGGESAGRKIARAIVEQRKRAPIRTTSQLVELIEKIVPPYSRRMHPATKVFQALRIVVNDELNAIKGFLHQAVRVLKPGGRLVVISFHSGEDRLVKQFFKEHKADWRVLTKQVVMAGEKEIKENPSARSARLRAATRVVLSD